MSFCEYFSDIQSSEEWGLVKQPFLFNFNCNKSKIIYCINERKAVPLQAVKSYRLCQRHIKSVYWRCFWRVETSQLSTFSSEQATMDAFVVWVFISSYLSPIRIMHLEMCLRTFCKLCVVVLWVDELYSYSVGFALPLSGKMVMRRPLLVERQ